MSDPSRRRRAAAAMLVVAIAITLLVAGTTTAEAAARVTVRNDRGSAAADTSYRTALTVTGRGFQSIRGGFGGVYLMFGWVDDPAGGSWRPSRGGLTGQDYRYVPDAEGSGNQGYLKFIAFPGSSTAGEAQAVLTGSGSFSLSLTVPGPVFRSVDRNGRPHDVDCRRVRCGIITIGAHGVANARNETFTPVPFRRVYGDVPRPTTTSAAAPNGGSAPAPSTTSRTAAAGPGVPSGTATASPPTASPGTAAAAGEGTPSLSVDRRTARPGRVLAFTGTGFRPGENVVGVLDDGAAGIGPLVAGQAGDVAGVLRLPRDLERGTHELRLTGAMSGVAALDRFPVAADSPLRSAAAAAPVARSSAGPSASRLFLLAAAVALVLAGAVAVRRLVLRRRNGGPAVDAVGKPTESPAGQHAGGTT